MLSLSKHEGCSRQPQTSLRKGVASLIPHPPLGKLANHALNPPRPVASRKR